MKEFEAQLETLNVANGDIVVLRMFNRPQRPIEAYELQVLRRTILRHLKLKGIENPRSYLIVLNGDAQISTLNEQEMNRLGWYRRDEDVQARTTI